MKVLKYQILQEMLIKYLLTPRFMDSSFVNGNATSGMIRSFAPKTEPGRLLCEIPIETQCLPVNRNEYINEQN